MDNINLQLCCFSWYLSTMFINFSTDRISREYPPDPRKPWGCWHQCAIWFPSWMHWENGMMQIWFLATELRYSLGIFTGGKWWNMGVDPFQSTLQLPSPCCSNWEENYMHAWWHRKVHKLSRADREAWKAHNNGCWIHNSNGPFMVISFTFTSISSNPLFLSVTLFFNLQVRSHREW